MEHACSDEKESICPMLPFDEVTFKKTLAPFCIECGTNEIEPDEPTFYGADLLLVVPFKCKKCGYSFSINIHIEPVSMITR